jgi:hypothetical protein
VPARAPEVKPRRALHAALAALALAACLLALPAAPPAGANEFADLADEVAERWVARQQPNGNFPNPVPAEVAIGHGGFAPPPLLYAIQRSGERLGDAARVAAAERGWPGAVHPLNASPFDIVAAAHAYRHLRLSAGTRAVVAAWLRGFAVPRNGALCILKPGCYSNLRLVDAAAALAAVRTGLRSEVPGARLSTPVRSRRAAARLINRRVPQIVDHRLAASVDGRRLRGTVLSDPPANPLAYHALSTLYLAEAVRDLGRRAAPRARRILRESLDALSVLMSPDGDASWMGRGQQLGWVPALTAAAMVEGAAFVADRRPGRAARYLAVAHRAVQRLRERHLVDWGLRMLPEPRATTAGHDPYVHTVAYNGLALHALTRAADIARRLPALPRRAVPAERRLAVADPRASGVAVSARRGTWLGVHAASAKLKDLRYDAGLLALKVRRREGGWRDLLAPRPLTEGLPHVESAGPMLMRRGVRGLPSGDAIRVARSGAVVVRGAFRTASERVLRGGVTFTYRPAPGGAIVAVDSVRKGDRYRLLLFTRAGTGAWTRRVVTAFGTRVRFPVAVRVRRVPGYHSGPVENLDALTVQLRARRDGRLRVRFRG